eukprot:TRINITY_DN57360_c0_g1_i1.p1 TRINITY_DN57360_c0_g1~~TRINITY_DN57360_c0_g1_i1.p1  ORF type:complete len:296 (+),score=31.17 TRINITY_DN57360_c0_g1_i1:838-1725(+)
MEKTKNSTKELKMASKKIKIDIADGVGTITLDRPEKMNAVDTAMLYEIIEAFDECDGNDEIKAIVVTGEGRAFCAGAELGGDDGNFLEPGHDAGAVVRDVGGLLTLRLFDMKKPVIAAVNGAAVGMGASMLLPMDYCIASDKAKFGFVFTRRGIVTESNSSYFLPRVVGIRKALDWCMTGRVFGPEEALQAGLISQICSPEELLETAYKLAHDIIDNTAPISVALTRQMLWKGLGWDHPMEAHKWESRGVSSRAASADAEEGVASFLEKRPAKFPLEISKDMPDFYPWWTDREYS